MTEETELLLRYYNIAWNQWDDEVVEQLLTADLQFRGSLGIHVQGRDEWRSYRNRIRAAVPDFHNEIIDLVASPGRVAARLNYTGHLHGELLGFHGHGQAISYAGAAFFTVEMGRLSRGWVLGDIDSLRQLIQPRD